MARVHLRDEATYSQVVERIGSLTPETAAGWGKMNVGQMLAHCAEVLEVTNGKELTGTPWLFRLIGPLIKRMVTRDGPYPHGSPTHQQYIMTETKDFEQERVRLLAALSAFRAAGPHDMRHPIFGQMTDEEVGWAAYRHLDHHLQQFGA